MGLMDDLGAGCVAVDTAIVIYWIEEASPYCGILEPLFDAVASGRREIVTSGITLLEVLVVPYRHGNDQLAREYDALLTRSRGVRLIDVDRAQLHAAAQLRALHRLRTPDALQISAAFAAGAEVFLTNDRSLPEIAGLRVVELDDYV